MARRKRKKAPSFSLKKVINMSRVALAGLKRNVLRSMYKTLNKKVKKTVKTFEKHGRGSELPNFLLNHPTNSNLMTNAELVNEIGKLSSFYLSSNSSYSSWLKNYKSQKEDFRRMLGSKKVTDAEYDEYRDFMRDMYYMYKNDMDPSDLYHESKDLYLLSKRLNLNPRQFMDNLENWRERLEELNENISDEGVISGNHLDIDVYSKAFNKVASWLEED